MGRSLSRADLRQVQRLCHVLIDQGSPLPKLTSSVWNISNTHLSTPKPHGATPSPINHAASPSRPSFTVVNTIVSCAVRLPILAWTRQACRAPQLSSILFHHLPQQLALAPPSRTFDCTYWYTRRSRQIQHNGRPHVCRWCCGLPRRARSGLALFRPPAVKRGD